jgi:hypothetical protein
MAKKELASPAPEMKDHKYDEYSVQSAFDTLMRAEEHKSDPKMMKAIHAKLKKHKSAIKSIQDLKTARDDAFADDED